MSILTLAATIVTDEEDSDELAGGSTAVSGTRSGAVPGGHESVEKKLPKERESVESGGATTNPATNSDGINIKLMTGLERVSLIQKDKAWSHTAKTPGAMRPTCGW